jgi:hypothetical protein
LVKSGNAKIGAVVRAFLSARKAVSVTSDHWNASRLSKLVNGAAMAPNSLMKRR